MLHLHRAERADGLLEALRDLLIQPLANVFAAEVIAVPTRGIERWLTQQMSARLGASPGRGDGACAHIAFPSPRRLLEEAVATASGIDPEHDLWLGDRDAWSLLEVVDEHLEEPWLHALSTHLAKDSLGEDDPSHRLTTVRHITDLFARYSLYRPQMVKRWAGGENTDDKGGALPAGAVWQPELWRRLRERIPQAEPTERLEAACARLYEEPTLVDLPERLSLFGLTRLPPGHGDVLRALAERRNVHLFLLHPSPALWDRVALSGAAGTVRRSDDVTAGLSRNRLLASWGHDARELQLVVGAREAHVDHHHPRDHVTDTLLGRLQADVRLDRSPPGLPLPEQEDVRPLLRDEDRSVQVHACHGRARQVEVLRDEILHLLAEDETLEPRDVIVMCPDIETFAPLIHATFGAGEAISDDEDRDPQLTGVGSPDLRVRLADRSVRHTNPVLGVVARVLELAGERLTASQVLDLGDREPVRRRFRLGDDDLGRVEEWVAASGIRWGLDAEHRARFKLEKVAVGTWRAGLDRILAGVAMTEEELRLLNGVLPLDDVEGTAIDLAGRIAELIDRLQAAIDSFTTPKPIHAWAEAIADAADALTATSDREAWQRAELERLLEDVVEEATTDRGVSASIVTLTEVLALLSERLEGRPTRANFRTGHLTVCTLMPMRSVPHRVVCLLGLDDGSFPRTAARDGDDLMLAAPAIGDRDPRTEDRQLLLDALLAAKDRLIITYTGNDERTNDRRPPAVPVGELLDVVDRTVRVDERRARDRIVIRHPLQPFDARNFTPGALVVGRPWSFDRVMLSGAVSSSRERVAPNFLTGPLGDPEGTQIELDDLVRFVEHPVRAFLRQRLGISVRDFSEEIDDALPVELDGLEEWGVGQRLLEARLRGADLEEAVTAEIARGSLPPGKLGDSVIEKVTPRVEAIARYAEELLDGSADSISVDIRLKLGDGRTLSGTVPGVCGDLVRTASYSRVGPKHRLATFVRWVALTAARPERPFRAATIGRVRAGQRSGLQVTAAKLAPAAPDPNARRDLAMRQLAALVELWDRGMREPLPLACQASAAYAEAAAAGREAEAAGREAWESDWNFDKEDKELEHQLVLGGILKFDDLLADPPRSDESGPAWEADESGRFGRYARRLWAGLLADEELIDC